MNTLHCTSPPEGWKNFSGNVIDISCSKFLELHLVVGDVPFPVARVLVDEHAVSVLVLPEDGRTFQEM